MSDILNRSPLTVMSWTQPMFTGQFTLTPDRPTKPYLQVRLCGPIWREGELASEHWLGPAHYRQGGTVQDIRQTAELTFIATVLFASAGLVLLQNPFLPVG